MYPPLAPPSSGIGEKVELMDSNDTGTIGSMMAAQPRQSSPYSTYVCPPIVTLLMIDAWLFGAGLLLPVVVGNCAMES
ncbi:hypothetical protein K503DRAFT_775280 [Rhizopogon vinicolor AM-OR11-026]|uniref:Uncharacterized protein n=1 Tax=Rhizopogon vinicolor AM-OR11-026 TaxID=1314800 RepID=A0A1B7MMC0_9AGAM|nr:hypothetical protein K503DRAFT_775280 [Rhizopogon vinicolor AM-OR11-026]